jgi:hypothetical protein
MKLTCYTLDGGPPPRLRPAPATRQWMDETPDAFAYRCLPLNIANAHGWEILCSVGFRASWNGQAHREAVQVEPDIAEHVPAIGHFGAGVLTFAVRCLFQTEPGYDLFVSGSPNRAKDGIAALTGIVEADWAGYGFTMNWRFTRPCSVRFEEGEPFCFLFPVKRGLLEAVEPEILSLEENPELAAQHTAFIEGCRNFLQDLRTPGTAAHETRWQKGYYRGLTPQGQPGASDHITKLRLKPFSEKT